MLNKLWGICRCGPFHVLLEIQFCRRQNIPVTVGMRKFLELQGWHSKEKNWKKTTRC